MLLSTWSLVRIPKSIRSILVPALLVPSCIAITSPEAAIDSHTVPYMSGRIYARGTVLPFRFDAEISVDRSCYTSRANCIYIYIRPMTDFYTLDYLSCYL
jgi:hypothetical protein